MPWQPPKLYNAKSSTPCSARSTRSMSSAKHFNIYSARGMRSTRIARPTPDPASIERQVELNRRLLPEPPRSPDERSAYASRSPLVPPSLRQNFAGKALRAILERVIECASYIGGLTGATSHATKHSRAGPRSSRKPARRPGSGSTDPHSFVPWVFLRRWLCACNVSLPADCCSRRLAQWPAGLGLRSGVAVWGCALRPPLSTRSCRARRRCRTRVPIDSNL